MKNNYPDKPIELTDATFDETVKKYPLIIIDCWADWCMPCRMLSPIIESLAKKYAGEIVFGKVNIEENQSIAQKYEIMSIPNMLVFKKGKMIDRIIGAIPESILESRIKQYL
jgi:thioredoxin 1